jgi:hypothetical protein
MRAIANVEGPLPGLDAEVAPGQALPTKLVFDVPADIAGPAFTLGTNLRFYPGSIILASDDHFLHKPTIVHLQ